MNENKLKDILKNTITDNWEREGLIETPKRIIKAWKEMTKGLSENPKQHLKFFHQKYDQLITVTFNFTSLCEHHFLPFFGKMTIGYIPNKKVLGLSKLVRIARVFIKRPQIQEKLVNEIADFLNEHLNPKGLGVYASAIHTCALARGVEKQAIFNTCALRGNFYQNDVKQEFLKNCKSLEVNL